MIQPFAMGVFVGLVLGFMLFLAFVFYCFKTEGRNKSEMKETDYVQG